MTGTEQQGACSVSFGNGNLQHIRSSKTCGYTGNNLCLDAFFHESPYLFDTPAKNKGITRLETNTILSFQSIADHHCIDTLLSFLLVLTVTTALTDIDGFCIIRDKLQYFL